MERSQQDRGTRRSGSSTCPAASRAPRASPSSARPTRSRSWCGASAPMRRRAAELASVRGELLLADMAVIEGALQKAEKQAKGKPGPEVEALRAAKDGARRRDAAARRRARRRAPGGAAGDRAAHAEARSRGGEPGGGDVGASRARRGPRRGLRRDRSRDRRDGPRARRAPCWRSSASHEPGLETVIAACYRALDLITFLTTGEDETRAWEVRRGATAPEAAGAIHTDLQRGFIRAEVIGYDELVAAGLDGGREGRRQDPRRGQGLRGAGRRHPARPVRGVGLDPADPRTTAGDPVQRRRVDHRDHVASAADLPDTGSGLALVGTDPGQLVVGLEAD